MLFDELMTMARASQTEADVNLHIPKDWTQGRTAFGGLSAAMVYEAMATKLTDSRELRSFTTNFVGPINALEPFTIEVSVLRQGKNATQIEGKALQNGNTCVVCLAIFAVARPSKIKVSNQPSHSMSLPKKATFIPQLPKVTPKFLRHVDLAFQQGRLSFTGSKVSHIHGWMRFSQAPEKITNAHIIALADSWAPAPLQMLRWPAPASSMSWNLEFIHPQANIAPTDWIAFKDETVQAADGYAHTEGHLWDPQGNLIALSRQTVGIFD